MRQRVAVLSLAISSLVVIAFMIPLAVLGAYAGSHIAATLPAATLRRCFAVFMIAVGGRMLWTA